MESKISKLLNLKSIPPQIIIRRVRKKIIRSIHFVAKNVNSLNKDNSLDYIFSHDFTTSMKFFYNTERENNTLDEIDDILNKNSIIMSADKICNHEFKLLGSAYIKLDRNLPWNEDFKTGFKWINEFHKDIKIIDLSNSADVKVPWELSRFQHVFTLGKAYWITNDEKYVLEFKNELIDWIIKNPPEKSVNWTCSMEVSIRAVNLICGYFFFENSKSLDNYFWKEFNKLLYVHGEFIYNNLEDGAFYNNNHYISDLVGLIFIGLYFQNLMIYSNKNNPQIWINYGIAEIEKEIKIQINDDGTDYEASTSYHRLVTEMLLITTILCEKNNIFFSKHFTVKVEKMCEFIMNIIKPNGLAPIVGDADDGRFIVASNYDNWNKRDFRYILAIAGEYFDRDDFRHIGDNDKEYAFWIMGRYKVVKEEIELKNMEYNDGGYYLLKNNKFYCFIRCGQLSCRGYGGHSHNDQLSFEINVDGEDFFIDSGTYVYTANYKMRNLFRSTKMHNTLYVDNYEQNDFNECDLFYMKEQTFAKCKLFNENIFNGEHYGFKLKCGIIHKRSISLQNTKLKIEDKLVGKTINNKVYINLVLDHGVDIQKEENRIILNKNDKKVLLEINNSYSVVDTYISYGYGEKVETKKIVIKMENMVSTINLTCI